MARVKRHAFDRLFESMLARMKTGVEDFLSDPFSFIPPPPLPEPRPKGRSKRRAKVEISETLQSNKTTSCGLVVDLVRGPDGVWGPA